MRYRTDERSRWSCLLLFFLYVSVSGSTHTVSAENQFILVAAQCKTVEECLSEGYNSTILKCVSCSSLSKFNLEPLRESCLQCCQFAQDEPTVKKYSKARLEICTCKFGAYPQIQAFVKSKLPEQHSNLQIRYVHGRDPIIKLIDETDEVKEIIAIEKWNTETVDEFLKTHVENDSADYLTSNSI